MVNYIALILTIIITILPILIIIAKLYNNKLNLPCMGCDDGSWWYKCLPYTGKGTITCDIQNMLEDVMKKAISLVKDAIGELVGIKDKLLSNFNTIKEKMRSVADALVNLDVGVPSIPNMPNISTSCGFTIPIINLKIDPCKLVTSGLQEVIGVVLNVLNTSLKLINKSISTLMDVFKFVAEKMVSVITSTFSLVLGPLEDLGNVFGDIKDEAGDIIGFVKESGLLKSILVYALSAVQAIIPIRSIYALAAILLMIILLPFMGGIFGFFMFIKNLIYVPLSLIF